MIPESARGMKHLQSNYPPRRGRVYQRGKALGKPPCPTEPVRPLVSRSQGAPSPAAPQPWDLCQETTLEPLPLCSRVHRHCVATRGVRTRHEPGHSTWQSITPPCPREYLFLPSLLPASSTGRGALVLVLLLSRLDQTFNCLSRMKRKGHFPSTNVAVNEEYSLPRGEARGRILNQ